MTAEAVKLPKVYRVAQRYRAECRDCPRRVGTSSTPDYWTSYPERTITGARYTALRHNEEVHPGASPATADLPSRDAPDKWVDDGVIGGYVCAVCGMPTESEPCPEHQPIAYTNMLGI